MSVLCDLAPHVVGSRIDVIVNVIAVCCLIRCVVVLVGVVVVVVVVVVVAVVAVVVTVVADVVDVLLYAFAYVIAPSCLGPPCPPTGMKLWIKCGIPC